MRLVSLTAAVAALTLSLIIAPLSVAAEDPPQKILRRHWGADDLVPTSQRTDLKKSVLPDALVAFDVRTNKVGVIRPLDEVTGIPVAGATTPQDTAEKYLRLHHAALGLTAKLSELQLTRQKEVGDLKVFSYAQLHDGLPVIGGDLSVSVLTKSLSIAGVGSHLVPIAARKPVTRSTDSAEAIQAVVDDVQRRYPSKADDLLQADCDARDSGAEWRPDGSLAGHLSHAGGHMERHRRCWHPRSPLGPG